MGDIATWVSMVTGVKKQLMDQGWSESAAELMVHALLTQSGGSGNAG